MQPAWIAAIAVASTFLVNIITKVVEVTWFNRGLESKAEAAALGLTAHQEECERRYIALEKTIGSLEKTIMGLKESSVDPDIFKLMLDAMTTKMQQVQQELGKRVDQIHKIQGDMNVVALKIERLSVLVERSQKPARRRKAKA